MDYPDKGKILADDELSLSCLFGVQELHSATVGARDDLSKRVRAPL